MSRLPVSVSRSRSRASRDPSLASHPYVPQPESLVLPNGPVGEEAAELLREFVHPSERHTTLIGVEGGSPQPPSVSGGNERQQCVDLPWWKRPSAWWLLILTPVTAIAVSATMAPRVEIYTILACQVYRPEYTAHINLGIPYHLEEPYPLDPYDHEHSWIYFADDPIGNTSTSLSKQPNLCASDPVVQAAVAKLSIAMTASMGVLGCLTTAWWGAFSDRFGRTRVMGITVIGILFTDFNIISVFFYSQRLPGHYWLLLLGPLVEGALGGLTSTIAAIHAYVSDCTEPAARSRMFSLSLGLLFTGMAVGPTVGSLLIHATSSPLSVFYLAATAHLIYALLIWFVIPESLTLTQMLASRQLYADEKQRVRAERDGPAISLLVRVKRLFGFLSPLSVLVPERLEPSSISLKGRKRDWNLVLLASSYGCTIMILGASTYMYQYATFTFNWTSETIGYWLSAVGASRATYLTLILPVVIKLFKHAPIELPVEPSEPLLQVPTPGQQDSSPVSVSTWDRSVANPRSEKEAQSTSFDLKLARASLIVDIFSCGLMGLAPNPGLFTIFTIIGSLGIGFSPAIQSVSLDLYSRRGGTETGRLFGALSVVQALCSQVLGPAIFGVTYVNTVAFFPAAIYFLSVILVTISLILLSCIHLPKDTPGIFDVEDQTTDESIVDVNREETLVDIEADEEEAGQGGKLRVQNSTFEV